MKCNASLLRKLNGRHERLLTRACATVHKQFMESLDFLSKNPPLQFEIASTLRDLFAEQGKTERHVNLL